ncbi:MAG: ABC transporter permease [bacterium]
MNIKIVVQSSFRNLRHHKIRSFLTILGIIVGITSIIATLAIGYGVEKKLRERILALGNNYIDMWSGTSFLEGALAATKKKKTKRLTIDDITLLEHMCPNIKHISPFFHGRTKVKYQNNIIRSQIKSGNQHFLSILGRSMGKGTFFSDVHVQKNARVAVLGYRASRELFRSLNPIGHIIKIKKIPFTVIGVVKKMENFFGIEDPNLDVFVPYTTFNRYVFPDPSRFVHGIIISSKSREVMPDLVKNITRTIRTSHNLTPGDPNDFSIVDQASMFKAAKASSGIFNLFLLIISSISLIVGGIGVMNIMLVSVSERTQEIGIRMALGAQQHTILQQFLSEAVILCFVGGLIGIGLGIASPFIACHFTKFPVVIKIQSIIIAFITIFLVGLIFGFYPAYKASKLNPVEALTR